MGGCLGDLEYCGLLFIYVIVFIRQRSKKLIIVLQHHCLFSFVQAKVTDANAQKVVAMVGEAR